MTAVIPSLSAISTQSGKGKKASEAITAPFRSNPNDLAFSIACFKASTREVQSDAAELEKERLDSVYREIAKLPDRCREVFTLAYVDGKKSVEIAGMLNISQRTVEAQLYKGLKIIRNVLALLALVLFFR